MEIILFGQLADIIGSSKIEVESVNSAQQLRNLLKASFPGISDLNYMIAVNKKLVTEEALFEGNEKIALLPPFSGG